MISKALIITALTALFILPLAADNTCMTAKCHTNFKAFKILHQPAADDCTTCHEKTGKHKFKPVKDKEKQCLECHDDKKEGKQVHDVLESDGCTICHTIHGGNYKAMLKTKRVDSTCFECHDQENMTKKFVHGPNASGNCALCHESHSSDHKPLLVTPKKTICTRCHTDKDFSGENKHMHSPMKQGCSGCHSPHSAEYKNQLISPLDSLCETCHEKIAKNAAAGTFKHAALQEDKKCFNCHDAHGSIYADNLRMSPLELCLKCHDKPIIGTDGKDYNIYKIITKSAFKHGPINDGNCSGCHNPHGSNFYKILTADFPKAFYTSYDEKKYAICFQCHESDLARSETTSTRTNFRDGNRNLHFVHVNLEKGRTCRACHEVHAGPVDNHIREETPFGSWSMPIEFEKTANGGSCAPGCHKAYSYDRNKKTQGG